MTTTPSIELDPDLILRVRSLSPQQRDALFDAAYDENEFPPVRDDEWTEIQRRIDEVNSGRAKLLTRDEMEQSIRTEIRKLGFEL